MRREYRITLSPSLDDDETGHCTGSLSPLSVSGACPESDGRTAKTLTLRQKSMGDPIVKVFLLRLWVIRDSQCFL